MKKVLAVASSGGHWEQLMLLKPVFDRCRTNYATTELAQARAHGIDRVARLPDCNQDRPVRAALCLLTAIWLVLRLRPQVVISTGAAPGFFCILIGRIIGAKTLWVDSVANAEQLSMCGRLSQRIAHQCLTQWSHLAQESSPKFTGSLL